MGFRILVNSLGAHAKPFGRQVYPPVCSEYTELRLVRSPFISTWLVHIAQSKLISLWLQIFRTTGDWRRRRWRRKKGNYIWGKNVYFFLTFLVCDGLVSLPKWQEKLRKSSIKVNVLIFQQILPIFIHSRRPARGPQLIETVYSRAKIFTGMDHKKNGKTLGCLIFLNHFLLESDWSEHIF